ncbi:biotin transporter BioY [Inconstantimicrobium porci]|uniref:Biotin transporter n=1 Tax=Inconstantimicrobium porci TaxID=2652291 RepID=A0A7X2T2K1_9CLOT|nr:biotin transporter BioY [Inconstantimicrobium porci]MSR92340.1 biotin transporter BioY [Inconstantimicrobium porci]
MKTRKIVLISLCSALMFIFSQMTIPLPFTAVPLTMQVFGVILISSLMPSSISPVAILIYLLLGAIGIPVFAGFSGGFTALIGPNGGYLIGFLLMSIVTSITAASKNKIVVFTGAYVGLAIDYIFGVLQLKIVTGMTLGAALAAGLYPFIIKDIMMTAVAVIIAARVKNRIPERLLCRS